jgi:hypothetical protein
MEAPPIGLIWWGLARFCLGCTGKLKPIRNHHSLEDKIIEPFVSMATRTGPAKANYQTVWFGLEQIPILQTYKLFKPFRNMKITPEHTVVSRTSAGIDKGLVRRVGKNFHTLKEQSQISIVSVDVQGLLIWGHRILHDLLTLSK